MTNILEQFNNAQSQKINEARGGIEKFVPDFKAGDNVTVNYKITEGDTTRIQAFTGVVIARKKSFKNYSASFTVRKISSDIGVERTFMLYSPLIESIKLNKRGIVRRAKLYYLRNLRGKAARIKEKLDFTSKKSAKKPTKKETVKTEG